MEIPTELFDNVLCFDTETAVLGDHVIEIGFSLFKHGQLVSETNMFIRPAVPIEKGASDVHKIYESDVEDAPLFADVAWYIHNTLSAVDVHIAYNYEYDRSVLEKEFARVGMNFPVKPMADPFVFFKEYNKYYKGKTLIKAAECYGVTLTGAHRAMNDATAAGRVLFKMAATKVSFPKTLKILLDKQRKMLVKHHLDFTKYLASKGEPPPREPQYWCYEYEI